MTDLDDQALLQVEARAGRVAVRLLSELFPFKPFPYTDETGVMRHGYGRPIRDRAMSQATATLALRSEVAHAQQVLRGRVFELIAVHPEAEARLPHLYAVGDILGAERLRDHNALWTALRQADWRQVGVELMTCQWDRYYGSTEEKRRAVMGLVFSITAPQPAPL